MATTKKKEVRKNGMAVASFVLGLVSFILVWFVPYLVIVISILAIVFGFVGLHQIKKNKSESGKKLAIWGIVLGFVFLLIVISLIAIGVVWYAVKESLNSQI
jgi:hypothetical protein